MPPFLTLKGVNLDVGEPPQRVVQDVDLEVASGECVVVLGANGSGKSSLLKLINGLYTPSAGTIILDGEVLNRQSIQHRARSIVTLTQDPNLTTFADLTVEENCALACQRAGISVPRTLGTQLAKYHPALSERFKTATGKLSGGERQSLALALALLCPPRLTILDEHTSALDPKAACRLMAQTHEALCRHQATALMTTHSLDDALRYGNRVIILRRGRIVFEANQEEKKNLTKQELLEYY